jgi:hypothetical protein
MWKYNVISFLKFVKQFCEYKNILAEHTVASYVNSTVKSELCVLVGIFTDFYTTVLKKKLANEANIVMENLSVG